MHFGITEKPTMDGISPYNNTGLIAKVSEKQSAKMLKIAVLDNPAGIWCPLPRNIWINLIPPETSHWPTFTPLIVWVYLHSNFCGGLQKTHLFCNRVQIGRSRSSKVVGFGTNQKVVCDFLLVINSNIGPILHRFWDTATYWLKIANFSYPTVI